ncbi:AAA family ATPase [Helcococcus kunzii]|uniref:RNA-binding domain-containing protein n=1 Tax=Helcococcus kunzii TaxID=40091 RepID=UPI001BB03FAE|nr:RNA-binding domain-containing protein [Helcococcus kunzii]QUY65616.1 AAA family ATPase [Helcococcus kunzii]
MRETYNLEFKEKISNTFLKTVTAYANYDGGRIIFGISDTGEVIGLENTTESSLVIENKINDSIFPKIDYSIKINEEEKTIELMVYPGTQIPYFYNSKTYKRNDSSTIEVDSHELKRLILDGKNITFDSLTSSVKNLNFTYLEQKLKDTIGINNIDTDVLKTLELMNKDEKFTNAGTLLADKNKFNIIDIVRFGEDQDTILNRIRIKGISVLEAYDIAIEKYREYYQYEVINGAYREKKELIPEKAFRETIANALVHRDWMRQPYIQISMNKDKIVVTSPGGLPNELSEKEFLDSQISIMRNPVIGNVFFRLDIIESFGTGIRRIKNSYISSKKKPLFTIYDNLVEIRLPIISGLEELTEDQNLIYNSLENKEMASSALTEITGFGKNKVLELLETLIHLGYVEKIGSGRGTKYKRK